MATNNAINAPTNKFLLNVVTQVFTGSGTYTPTTGMIACIVRGTGGGAGGGGGAATAGQATVGGGGAGGGYFEKTFTAANIGANAAVVIGPGGAGGASGNNNGIDGTATTFTPAGTGAVLTANGGAHGNGSAGSATTVAAAGGVGGTATNGDINVKGGNGEFGLVIVGSTGVAFGGSGGQSPLSNTQFDNGGAAAAVGYGGGGCGGLNANANVAGTAGSNGVVIVTEFVSF